MRSPIGLQAGDLQGDRHRPLHLCGPQERRSWSAIRHIRHLQTASLPGRSPPERSCSSEHLITLCRPSGFFSIRRKAGHRFKKMANNRPKATAHHETPLILPTGRVQRGEHAALEPQKANPFRDRQPLALSRMLNKEIAKCRLASRCSRGRR